ncbi:MATH/TRAF domain-containing protein [Hirschfeldia incana]|nr:MATH/TRAF domain-containing protein [Hirschfeldia incana]
MSKAKKSSSDSTITYKIADRLPSTYSMKIQSLSQLKTLFSGTSGYKSRTFSSGKYNWRLVIYPKGNKKDNGTGFLSMYVELDSKSVSSTILAYLTFFIYNKKENKYFTIQDDINEGKQFNALRSVHGFPQVLPLDTFNDPKNGYVFDGDQCEFGVDVMVPLTNWEVVSYTQEFSNPKFHWTLKKFSKLKEHCYVSNKLLAGGSNWVLRLYPKGEDTACSAWLSLFLQIGDGETMNTGEEIYVQCDIRILDPIGGNHLTRKFNQRLSNSTPSWGWREFVSLAHLEKAYLDKQGTLKVEIEFEVVSTTKYS